MMDTHLRKFEITPNTVQTPSEQAHICYCVQTDITWFLLSDEVAIQLVI